MTNLIYLKTPKYLEVGDIVARGLGERGFIEYYLQVMDIEGFGDRWQVFFSNETKQVYSTKEIIRVLI